MCARSQECLPKDNDDGDLSMLHMDSEDIRGALEVQYEQQRITDSFQIEAGGIEATGERKAEQERKAYAQAVYIELAQVVVYLLTRALNGAIRENAPSAREVWNTGRCAVGTGSLEASTSGDGAQCINPGIDRSA